MKILRVHGAGTDAALARSVGDAFAQFNADLDIRLRFLSIGIDEVVLDVSDGAGGDPAAAAVDRAGAALATGTFDVVVLLGGGVAGLAAATAAARARVPLVRVGAGVRSSGDDGTARGIDRLAAFHLAFSQADATALRDEGIPGAEVVSGASAEWASQIVRAVTRRRAT